MADGKRTNLEPGFIARVVAGARFAVTGKAPDFFGPGEPPATVAPKETVGRQFDFPSAYNISAKPRKDEPISFEQLRSLADGYDLMRLVIETRKDQLAKLRWGVRPKDQDAAAKEDPRVKELTEFLSSPDKEHSWNTWLRMLVEDMLVLDAAAIYPRRNLGGRVYALELIDGATIKRVLGEDGRTPIPPAPAYQQVLKGMAAVNYTRNELLYLPRNVRTNRVYGFGPVEQVVMTVNIALRRQVHQLNYYTEGNVPEALCGVPETWSADQIAQFQAYWDALLEGDMAQRRHLRFVPATLSKSFVQTKEGALKDEYDEWLARIICYAFSVSAQAFIKQMNRSTADNAQEQALQEGLAPLQAWVKEVMDRVIQTIFGYTDLEFCWPEEEDQDPLTQAQINKIYLDAGVLCRNEVRKLIGAATITGGDVYTITTGTGVVPLADALEPPKPQPQPPQLGHNGGPPLDDQRGDPKEDKPEKDMSKAADGLDRDRSILRVSRKALSSLWSDFLADQAEQISAAVATALDGKLSKADQPDQPEQTPAATRAGEAAAATDAGSEGLKAAEETAAAVVDMPAWEKAVTKTMEILEEVAVDGIEQGFNAVGITSADATALANPRAVAWAEAHAAKLVSGLTNTTQNALRDLIVKAEKEGWSVKRLQDEIVNSYAFSPERAELIAQHELASADIMGNLMGWQTAQEKYGMKLRKRWIVAPMENNCPACLENARAGALDLDEEFPSGHLAAPAHPRCHCDLVAEADDDAEKVEGHRTRSPFDLAKAFNADQPRDAQGRWTSGGAYDAEAEILRGRSAMHLAISEKRDVQDAMRSPQVGLVSFVWGQPGNAAKSFKGGFGISHVIEKRNSEGIDGQAVAMKIPEVIAKGEYGKPYGPASFQRVNVVHDGHTAVLSQNGTGGHWLLTGWRE